MCLSETSFQALILGSWCESRRVHSNLISPFPLMSSLSDRERNGFMHEPLWDISWQWEFRLEKVSTVAGIISCCSNQQVAEGLKGKALICVMAGLTIVVELWVLLSSQCLPIGCRECGCQLLISCALTGTSRKPSTQLMFATAVWRSASWEHYPIEDAYLSWEVVHR